MTAALHLIAMTTLTLRSNGRTLARMIKGSPCLVSAGIAALLFAVLPIACSNYQPNKIAFHFTPIPITALPDGTPVTLDATTCVVSSPDEVIITFDTGQRVGLEQWLDAIGFTVRKKFEPSDRERKTLPTASANVSTYDIGVPLGSVPDAIALIAKRPGVLSAESAAYGSVPEAGPPGAIFGCKKSR